MKPFFLEILTLEHPIFSGEVVSLTAPGVFGDFGILAGHAPFVSVLKKGRLKVNPLDGKEVSIPLNGGILRVEKNRVVVLSETE